MDNPKPILGVNIAIIMEGKVLLTRRRDFEVWCLPGGEVEAGETLTQAAMREAREEVGLEVKIERLVGIHSRPQWLSRGGHVIVFAASRLGGELAIQDQEVIDARDFSREDLPGEILLGHRQQILDSLDGVCGAVWVHNSEWNFPPGLTRQEVYELRDRSGLPPAEFYQEHIGKDIPGSHRLEVPEKLMYTSGKERLKTKSQVFANDDD